MNELAYHVINLILNAIDCYYCCSYVCLRLEVVGNRLIADGIRTSCVVIEKRSMRER